MEVHGCSEGGCAEGWSVKSVPVKVGVRSDSPEMAVLLERCM